MGEKDEGLGASANSPKPEPKQKQKPKPEPDRERAEPGVFGPPRLNKDGMPECYGQFISGRRCDCDWSTSCKFYTFDHKGERSRQSRWDNYEAMPIIEDMEWADESSEPSRMHKFKLPGGKTIEASAMHLPIIQVCVWLALEKPAAMRALMLKLDPDVKSLQDIADILKISKQAVQKRVAGELGIGKRRFKDSTLLQLSETEMRVYKMCVRNGMNTRRAAKQLGMSTHASVIKILDKLRQMGMAPKKRRVKAKRRRP